MINLGELFDLEQFKPLEQGRLEHIIKEAESLDGEEKVFESGTDIKFRESVFGNTLLPRANFFNPQNLFTIKRYSLEELSLSRELINPGKVEMNYKIGRIYIPNINIISKKKEYEIPLRLHPEFRKFGDIDSIVSPIDYLVLTQNEEGEVLRVVRKPEECLSFNKSSHYIVGYIFKRDEYGPTIKVPRGVQL